MDIWIWYLPRCTQSRQHDDAPWRVVHSYCKQPSQGVVLQMPPRMSSIWPSHRWYLYLTYEDWSQKRVVMSTFQKGPILCFNMVWTVINHMISRFGILNEKSESWRMNFFNSLNAAKSGTLTENLSGACQPSLSRIDECQHLRDIISLVKLCDTSWKKELPNTFCH